MKRVNNEHILKSGAYSEGGGWGAPPPGCSKFCEKVEREEKLAKFGIHPPPSELIPEYSCLKLLEKSQKGIGLLQVFYLKVREAAKKSSSFNGWAIKRGGGGERGGH